MEVWRALLDEIIFIVMIEGLELVFLFLFIWGSFEGSLLVMSVYYYGRRSGLIPCKHTASAASRGEFSSVVVFFCFLFFSSHETDRHDWTGA